MPIPPFLAVKRHDHDKYFHTPCRPHGFSMLLLLLPPRLTRKTVLTMLASATVSKIHWGSLLYVHSLIG